LRSSSILTGTTPGASPMARSDAIMPMYQMIHIAQSPRINPRAVGSKLELWAPRAVELGLLLLV